MDEFQDTTQIQYDLVRTIFLGTDAVITAVGDNKQQIMRWAMAMDDPFTAFDADFAAQRTPLYNNYRSSPELVRIQHNLAIQTRDIATSPEWGEVRLRPWGCQTTQTSTKGLTGANLGSNSSIRLAH